MSDNNLISDLTEGKQKSIGFGSGIPELNFNPIEFINHYKKYESEELKQHYRDKCNEARKLNGLKPI